MMNFLVLNKYNLVESISSSNLKYTLSSKSHRIMEFDKNFNKNESKKLFCKIFQYFKYKNINIFKVFL
jgi:hypothetical protein